MTAKEAVFELLERERQRGGSAQHDIETVRREWLLALSELMSLVREWLGEAEREALLSITEHSISIHEERLGRYDAPAMEITTPGGIAIKIRPKARFVVGGMGRVDFSTSSKSEILVRKDRATWQFARLVSAEGRWSFVDLDENSFWQTLNELML